MARLVCESGPLQGKEWTIEPGLTLGREPHNNIAMPDNRKSSRDHAKVWRESPGKYTVADLGSTNGTFVNDGKITRQPLVDGDEISIGEVKFRFVLDDADKPQAAKKREGPPANLHDVLAGKAPLHGAGTGGPAGTEGAAGGKVEIKGGRILQYQKKTAKGSVASWDMAQSSGVTKWVLVLVVIAVAAGLFLVVRNLIAGS